MAVVIGTNIASKRAQTRLGQVSDEIGKTSERLSSGLRINRSSDDAAGLSVSTSLNTRARIYGQAVKNVNDVISAFSIATGAVGQLAEIAQRLGELAPQAANGTLSGKQRIALDKEAQGLSAEFNRIIDTTTFNGISLLSQSAQQINVQVSDSAVQLSLGFTTQGGDGTFRSAIPAFNIDNPGFATAADFNGDGNLDLATGSTTTGNIQVLIGNGNGTFKAVVTYVGGWAGGLVSQDFNGDGKVDLAGDDMLLYGNGDGTFQAVQHLGRVYAGGPIAVADLNGDGLPDFVSGAQSSAGGSGTVDVFLANPNGGFLPVANYLTTSSRMDTELYIEDVNNDGKIDLLTLGRLTNVMSVNLGNGDGTFRTSTSYTTGTNPRSFAFSDFTGDGISDAVTFNFTSQNATLLAGRADGTFGSAVTIDIGGYDAGTTAFGDINRDGNTDLIVGIAGGSTVTLFGNGDGTFNRSGQVTGAGIFAKVLADFNNDGFDDLYVANAVGLYLGNGGAANVSIASLKIRKGDIELWNQYSAKQALPYVAKLQTNLSNAVGSLGAMESRLQVQRRVADVTRLEYTTAASRIQDADIAEEAARLVAKQVLQQATAAVLAQANHQPDLALELLRG